MGLDMYLSAKKYVGDWGHTQADERAAYKKITDAIGISGFSCPGSPHLDVKVCVAYWRKANQVHRWFVEHCQDGIDECQETCVTREQLKELVEACEQSLASKETGALPPQAGFFFGSTDIDDGYWQDLQATVDQLKPLLGDEKWEDWGFYYRASW